MGNRVGGRSQPPTMEERFTRPQWLYPHPDIDLRKLHRLILEAKLAPCHQRGDLDECPMCFLLDELEKQLADEVKVRNKAERRLSRAIKKLESLKILDVELSYGSISSLSSNGRSAQRALEVGESLRGTVLDR